MTPLLKIVPVSDRLAAIVHKALARDPARRYPDVLALLHDVECVFEGRPVAALKEGSLKRLGRLYMSQSKRYARFRTVDVDMLCWSLYALGLATGVALIHYKPPHLGLIATVAADDPNPGPDEP